MDQASLLREKMQNKEQKSCRTIAVVSGKGGVGKSNITTNFSLALVEKGHRVLIVDMDLGMGNIHILLGKTTQYSLTNYLQGECTIDDTIFKDPTRLDFVSGGSGMTSLLRWSDEMFDRLIFAFEELQKNYDFILFDMGAGATEWSLQFIMSVDDIFVVSTTEPTSITDAYSMMKYIYKRNEDKHFHLICNRALSPNEGIITLKRLRTTMEQFLKKEVSELGVVLEDMNVRKAIIQQIPFKVLYPKSKASQTMDLMASRYVNTYENTPVEIVQNNLFLNKLKGLFSSGRV